MGEAQEALAVFSQNNPEPWGRGTGGGESKVLKEDPPNVPYDPRYTVTKSINTVT